jgi:hypothetical protein
MLVLIFSTKLVTKRGCSLIFLKNRKTAFYATTCTVVWLASMYSKLLLKFLSTFNAHLSIVRMKISAFAKIAFVGSSADSTLLKHAYTTQPYCRTLETNAFTNYSLTRMLDIPNILQFILTAWNVRSALLILSCNITSGLLLLFVMIRPKYLNFSTTVIFYLFTYKSPLQLTYIASVLDILISSALLSQKALKQFINPYNYSGDEASRTTSSANASKNNCNDAIVYARRFLPFIAYVL